VDGEPGYVVRAEDADELAATPDTPAVGRGGDDGLGGGVVLLPGFDPWVIAPLSHRTRTIPPGRTPEVSRTAGWISPVLVVDGAVAGVWRLERRGAEPTITIRTFAPLAVPVRAAAQRHAERYARLLDAEKTPVSRA
jgi:Winged helix DNA-binding domain